MLDYNKKRDKSNEANQRFLHRNPWFKHYDSARCRCVLKTGSYFGRIKFLMTVDDFKKLWFRDKAWLLNKPSIDRIDNAGDYMINNCRFIELKENQSFGGKIGGKFNKGRTNPRAINNPQTFKKGNIPWNKGKKLINRKLANKKGTHV